MEHILGYSGHTMEVSTMRLFKKAAVCLLAAAMAVSMLTACGDDGPSNPGNGGNGGSTGGGNTSTSTPAKPDEGNSGNTSGGSEENGSTTTYPTSWNASKTKAYINKNGISDTNIYVAGTLVRTDSSGTPQSSAAVEYVVRGNKIYAYMKDGTSSAAVYKNDSGKYFISANGSPWYECKERDQVAVAQKLINNLKNVYRIPSSPNKFEAFRQSGYYMERMAVTLNNQLWVYAYSFYDNGTLGAIASGTSANSIFVTSPVTLTACPNSFAFPNT